MSTWELSTDRSTWTAFASAGVSACSFSFVACAVDRCVLSVDGDYLANAIYAHGNTVYVRQDGIQRFIGRVVGIPRQATGAAESYAITLAGAWWWLERVAAWQAWMSAEYSRFVVGQDDEDGSLIDVATAVRNAIQGAITRGVPITIAEGAIANIGQIPPFESSNQRLSDIILAVVRWYPDTVVWWDYSGAAPAIHMQRSASSSATTLDLAASPPAKISIAPRYDDQAVGVRIVYEIQSEHEGQIINSIETDTAGSANSPLALEAVFQLRAYSQSRSSITTYSQTIVCQAMSTTDKSFWKDVFFGALGAIPDADWSLDDVSSGSITKYAFRLTQGTFQPWMGSPGLGYFCHTEEWAIIVTITTRVPADETAAIITQRRLVCRMTTTSAPSGTYQYAASGDLVTTPGDVIPTGLAAGLYAAWGRLNYDGRIVLVDAEPPWHLPGRVLNVTGGLAEWATMAALVRQIDIDVATGSTAITLGAPGRIEADNAIAFMRAIRGYRKPAIPRDQADTDPVSSIPSIGPMLSSAQHDISEGDLGLISRLMLSHTDGRTITIDTASLANIDEESEDIPALSVQPIWEVVPTWDEDGALVNLAFRQRQALVGAPGPDTDVAVNDCATAPEVPE